MLVYMINQYVSQNGIYITMNIEDQTLCPKCHNIFTDSNPPRLLTMCGHTFCEKCIKDLPVKKKNNNKWNLICPIDKISLDISNPNFTFPKNLCLLKLTKKKMENILVNNAIPNIVKHEEASFQSEITIQNFENELSRLSFCSNSNPFKQNMIPHQLIESISAQTCLLHQKPIELVCIRDCQRICASCVIFGQHRGHIVKNASEVERMASDLMTKLKHFLKQEKNQFKKLESQDLEQKIQSLLNRKKSQLHKQIAKKFKKLVDHVINTEKKLQSKLQKKIQEYHSKIKANLQQRIALKEKYKDWQQNLEQRINCLSHQSQQQKLKIVLKSDAFIELSERNLNSIQTIYTEMVNESEGIIDSLVLNSDDQHMKHTLKEYCRFEECINSFLDINTSRMNFSRLLTEESLLDDIESITADNSLVRTSEKSTENEEIKIKKNPVCYTQPTDVLCTTSRIDRITNAADNNRIKADPNTSPNRKNNTLKSSRFLGANGSRASLHGATRLKDLPKKVQTKVESIMMGSTDVLDLTNGQLGNQKTLAILEYIKQKPVIIVKLVRNRLTDECLIKFIPLMSKVTMLNVSRNDLTEISLEHILKERRQGKLKSLKSLMIGQNKIIERKHKDIFEELKKLGVNICI